MENGNAESGRSDNLMDALNSPLFASSTSSNHHRNSNGRKNSNITVDDNTDINNRNDSEGSESSVTAKQEIQTLLLILLAQVCALHDSTPKTFVVHVLSLYERGILDYESIGFVFDLGLVPSLPSFPNVSPTARLSNYAFDREENNAEENHHKYGANNSVEKNTSIQNTLDNNTQELAAIIPYQKHQSYGFHSNDDRTSSDTIKFDGTQIIHQIAHLPRSTTIDPDAQLRSKHVYAIRSHLESYHQSSASSNTSQSMHNFPLLSASSQASWSVEHHPLSLSRYNREFIQKRLLASGAFGEVFQSMNKLDNVDYAIKRVVFSAKGYDYSQVELVIREVKCLAKLGHENVVRYYTSWLEPSWMTGTSSDDHDDDENAHRSEYNCDSSNPDGLASNNMEKILLKNIQRLVIGDTNDLNINGRAEDEILSTIENEMRNIDHSKDKTSWSFDEGSHSDCSYNAISEGGYGASDCSEWSQDLNSHDGVSKHDPRNQLNPRDSFKNTRSFSSNGYRYQICLFIQMQLCRPSTLADWIRDRNTRNMASSLKEQHYLKAWDIFQQIANGLSHIHSKNVVHRDLKPANIFYSVEETDDCFKIGDFGLSKLLRRANLDDDFSEDAIIPLNVAGLQTSNYLQEHHTQGVGTSSYAAPEQLLSQKYGSEADIFSLGLILLELFSSFDSEHERAKVFHDCRKGILPKKFLVGDSYLKNVGDLILALTAHQQSERPTAVQIVQLEISNQAKVTDFQNSLIRNLRNNVAQKEAEIVLLRMQIEERDNVIKEQQKIIQYLRSEKTDNHVDEVDRMTMGVVAHKNRT